MNEILLKHRDIKPVNDVADAEQLLSHLVELDPIKQQLYWIKSEEIGFVCVYQHPDVPNRVIEYVQGTKSDSVSTLYEGNEKIADLERLAEVRRELMGEIGAVLMRLPSTIAVYDGGREREAALKELGTAQLMDVLAHFTGTDINTL